jgi:TetR/AcrR family transcriptional regulator
MARPRSARYELQREQMLAAAAQLFATQGYTATTMQQVAAACQVSKATLYHYVRDKQALLAQITEGHVGRLEQLVHEVEAQQLSPRALLQALISRFMQVYAQSEYEHRVLTEDVKFLGEAERQAVLNGQRRVVRAFARAVGGVRPDLQADGLDKPLAMLLFGMINWTFTWLRSGGPLTHESLAPLVVGLFLGGLDALRPVPAAALAPVG